MKQNLGVSRRGFVKGVAGTAAVPGAMAGVASANTETMPAGVSIAATVVRVSHSRMESHALRIGVRASVQGPDYDMDGIVLIVDPVPFGASAADMRNLISRSIEKQVAGLLEQRGLAVTAERFAVQVFGGVLG